MEDLDVREVPRIAQTVTERIQNFVREYELSHPDGQASHVENLDKLRSLMEKMLEYVKSCGQMNRTFKVDDLVQVLTSLAQAFNHLVDLILGEEVKVSATPSLRANPQSILAVDPQTPNRLEITADPGSGQARKLVPVTSVVCFRGRGNNDTAAPPAEPAKRSIVRPAHPCRSEKLAAVAGRRGWGSGRRVEGDITSLSVQTKGGRAWPSSFRH